MMATSMPKRRDLEAQRVADRLDGPLRGVIEAAAGEDELSAHAS